MCFLSWVLLFTASSNLLAQPAEDEASPPVKSITPLIPKQLEPVRMQLRWHHQFQFAGYYAAKEQGFYERAGFDVTIVPGSPQVRPVDEVLAGRAQFAEANSEVLLARLRGKPLVALAAIFQQSPAVLVTLKKSGITQPQDLIGKRMMSVGGESDAGFLAMLKAENVSPDQVDLIPSSYQIQDLIDGKTDAFNSYLTNEPYFLEERGIGYNIINPRDYGVDFYSDILFTTEAAVTDNPERVLRFKKASLAGWEYALAHPDEIIRLIREKYNDEKSLNHMRFEALLTHEITMPDLVEVGYINPRRFEAMADVFIEQKMVENNEQLAGFVFSDPEELSAELYSLLFTVCIFLVAVLLVALALALFNHRLKAEVSERKKVEEQLKRLANTDSLTQLFNRRAFSARYKDELVRAQRYGDIFSIILIDLDYFKKINDSHGREAGDRVLMAVAQLLKDNSRETDSCARFGGEEFILLLPKTSQEEAVVYAARLCEKIRGKQVSLLSGETASVTASIGVAQWLPEERGEATIIRVDKLLYTAEKQGRDRVVTADCTSETIPVKSEASNG